MKSNKLPTYLLYKKILAEGQRLVALENENFLAIIMKFAWKISELIIHRDRKVTSKLKVFYRFGKYLVFLNKKHGSSFVAKYLKASLLAIQRAIAGSPIKSLREIEPDLPLPRLSKSGLPGWIGTRDRRAILSHSLSVVQFYLTIFSLYRVIQAPVRAKIETITAPSIASETFLEQSLGYFEFKFKKLIRVPKFSLRGEKGRDAQLLLLQTSSSSNSRFSWLGWAYDAWLIRKDPAMYSLIRKWLELTNNFDLLSLLNMSRVKPVGVSGIRVSPHLKGQSEAYLGRLSFKEEAAGKLRVFAMVDVWTQSIFKPLHSLLFRILSSLPNDSTFNQGVAFKRAVSKAEKSGHSYGFDLSAATDRLPLIIQIKLLSGIIGAHLASLWGLILTERDYFLPANHYELQVGPLRYAVGQPMGALSSWAMLALTHHAIVQYAYQLIGGVGWTEDYEVLGDDIVIFNPSLASKYVELMSLYGVELNMGKSVISHGSQPVVEFAKRTSLKGKDVSPLSMKMFLNQDSFKGRLSIFAWWATRIESHFIPAFKTIMKSVRWDNRPGNDKFAILGLLSLSISSGLLPFEWMLREMKDQRAYFVRKGKMLLADFDSTWAFQISKAILEKKDIMSFEPRNPHSYMFEQRWYKAAIIRRITGLIQSYNSVDPYIVKKNILTRIGLGGQCGVFVHHLWLPYLDGLVANSYLTLRFYNGMVLSKYSLAMLITFLEEVESAASVLAAVKKDKKEAKVLKDGLRFLQFIDKTIAKGFRDKQANQKLALESSWTQITEKKSASPLNWLVPGFGGLTPTSGPVQWLGTSGGNFPPREMPTLSSKQRHMMFGEKNEFLIKPNDAVKPSFYKSLNESAFVSWLYQSTLWSIPFLSIFLILDYLISNGLSIGEQIVNSLPSELDVTPEGKSDPGSDLVDNKTRGTAKSSLNGDLFMDLVLTFCVLIFFFGPLLYFLHQWELLSINQYIDSFVSEYDLPDLQLEDGRHPFLFPSLRELIQWRDAELPSIVRSPQIGFGWSEPWVQNQDWPEAWR